MSGIFFISGIISCVIMAFRADRVDIPCWTELTFLLLLLLLLLFWVNTVYSSVGTPKLIVVGA